MRKEAVVPCLLYTSGMEDGLFPSMMSINSDDRTDLEEERRLCYVGITRAKKELVLTSARQRMVNGETRYCKPSRFLEEVPEGLLDEERLEPVLGSYGSRGNGAGPVSYTHLAGIPYLLHPPIRPERFCGSGRICRSRLSSGCPSRLFQG